MEGEIDLKQFKRLKRISKGSFGFVYQIQEKKTGNMYAAKVVDCDDDVEKCNEMVKREVNILMYTKHPTIIKFIGYSKTDFLEENNVTIIMELAKNGSLREILKQIQQNDGPKNYTNTTRQIILVGVARGMKYLHDRNIIHCNVKPENILLDENLQPHITDFGLSKFYEVGHSYSQTKFGGTLPYEAPEILNKKKYDVKVDVYSFSILMFEVLTDCVPYPELLNNDMPEYDFASKVVNQNYRPKFSVPIKDSLRELIEQCWSANPSDRPTFDEIFNKLSNKTGEEEEENFLLDDVDKDELNLYVEDITEITDSTEKLLSQISKLEEDNKQLKNEIKKQSDTIKTLEEENRQLKNEIKRINDKQDDNNKQNPTKPTKTFNSFTTSNFNTQKAKPPALNTSGQSTTTAAKDNSKKNQTTMRTMSSKQINTPSVLQNIKKPSTPESPVKTNSAPNEQKQQQQQDTNQQPSSDQNPEQQATNQPEGQQNAANNNQNQPQQQQEEQQDTVTQTRNILFALIQQYSRTNSQQDLDNLNRLLGFICEQPTQFQTEINQFLIACMQFVEQQNNEAQAQLEEATQQNNIQRKLDLTNQSKFLDTLHSRLGEIAAIINQSITQQTQNEAAAAQQQQSNPQQSQEAAQNEAASPEGFSQQPQEQQEVAEKPRYSFGGKKVSTDGGIAKNNSPYKHETKEGAEKKFDWKSKESWNKCSADPNVATARRGWEKVTSSKPLSFNKPKQSDGSSTTFAAAWSSKNKF